MANSTLSSSDTAERLTNTPFVHLNGILYASYVTAGFADASAFVARVALVAEALNHHPDIRLGYGRVEFELSSHDVGGVTERDLELAEKIAELADAAGVTPKLVRPSRYEFSIDTIDANGIRAFWKAALDYGEREKDGGADLVDPRGRGPSVWFQHREPPRIERNRVHVDVYVPTADTKARVQAVLSASGTMVTDEHAPDWWVMADIEGNELCICTSRD